MLIREPFVAGEFYPADRAELISMLKKCFLDNRFGPGSLPMKGNSKRTIVGIISPHAGYQYSGSVAANGYFELSKEKKPDLIVIIGPNHEGIGSEVSCFPNGYWKTPLGNVKVDSSLIKDLNDDMLSFDEISHSYEHSIEVQLPFLQFIFDNDFEIAPISLMNQNIEVAQRLASDLFKLSAKRDILVVASTDFTHYEPSSEVNRRDKMAIDSILKLNVESFYDTISRNNITMCGYGAVATLMFLSDMMHAEGKLLKHATSGEVIGDNSLSVGYSSIVFKRV